MKKILSLTLAALMVVSMIPTAFAADVDYTNGTQVEATGTRSTVEDDGSVTHNAEYTITVPAMLAPGGSGTVTLEGYWPSDATVKVTAEDKVEVVNNINSADKKELAVAFASIEKAGSNTAVVTASAPVSVANIENALFGKWAGKFNYNVEYNGEAGGSGTVTPTPDPDDGEATRSKFGIKTLYITEYTYEVGMTWAEWIESEYNSEGYAVKQMKHKTDGDISTVIVSKDNGGYIEVNTSSVAWPTDTIDETKTYSVKLFADSSYEYYEEPEANLITFTISGGSYQAEEGMTWAEWIVSNYNPDKGTSWDYEVSDNKIVANSNGVYIAWDNDEYTAVTPDETIQATAYVLF